MGKIYKFVIRLIFSHVGLFFVLIGYCALGAIMFQAIEGDRVWDRLQRGDSRAKEIEMERKELIKKVTSIKRLHNTSIKSIWKGHEEIKGLIDDYHLNLTEAIKWYGYDGTVNDEIKWPWSFGSAFLFCASTITLLGYGHVNPETELGQFVVLPYALLGIPLMLMYLAMVGKLFASLLSFMYTRCCCRPFTAKRNATRRMYGRNSEGLIVDAEAKEGGKRGEAKKAKKTSVPVTLILMVIFVYLLIGAIAFLLLEEWSFGESFYFCFFSLTTVGFGDYVPGKLSVETIGGQLKLFGTSIYVILGIGIVAMGINFIVEALTHTIGVGQISEGVDENLKENLKELVQLNAAVANPKPAE